MTSAKVMKHTCARLLVGYFLLAYTVVWHKIWVITYNIHMMNDQGDTESSGGGGVVSGDDSDDGCGDIGDKW